MKQYKKKLKEGMEFPGDDLHSRLCQFTYDTVDYFDLADEVGDYGDYPTQRDSIHAAIWDMSDEELIEGIKYGLEEGNLSYYGYPNLSLEDLENNAKKDAQALVDEYNKKYSVKESKIKESRTRTLYHIYGFDGEKRFGPHNFKIEVFYDNKEEAINIAQNIAKNIDKYSVPTDTQMIVREEIYDKNDVCVSSKQIWSSLIGSLNEKVMDFFNGVDIKPISISYLGVKEIWGENDITYGKVAFKVTLRYTPTDEIWSEIWEATCIGKLDTSYGVSEPNMIDVVWTELIDAHFEDYMEVVSDEVNDYYMEHDDSIVNGVCSMIEECIENKCEFIEYSEPING